MKELDATRAKVKTDIIDSKTLAQLLRADLVAECYVPSKENREKRALIRERTSLTKIRTELRNKIHDLLAKYEYSARASRIELRSLFSAVSRGRVSSRMTSHGLSQIPQVNRAAARLAIVIYFAW